jgi:ABC-type Fe3+-siderophore transport system permease subunit
MLSWRSILEYVLTNTGTGKDAAIWRVSGGFGAALSSRLWGYPTYLMLGPFAGVFAIWLVLGFCFASVRRNRPAMLFILSGIALAAISLLLISADAMVDPHFSLSWEILFVLTTLFAVAEIIKTERASFLGIAFCAMALFTFYKAPPTRNACEACRSARRADPTQLLPSVFGRVVSPKRPYCIRRSGARYSCSTTLD